MLYEERLRAKDMFYCATVVSEPEDVGVKLV
jgi:hypothetical protein